MPLLSPVCTVRHYSGEHAAHSHDHAQIMFALAGSLSLEVEGRGAVADVSTGIVVPAGASHAYAAPHGARMLVIDAPMCAGTEHLRGFAVRAEWRVDPPCDVAPLLQALLQTPRVLSRRVLNLGLLNARLDEALHEPWSTARMAALCQLSPQRFHARLVELTGLSPMAYLRQRRLDAAIGWLGREVLLDDVAWRVGYGSASALSYALLRDRGFSTRTFRRRASQVFL